MRILALLVLAGGAAVASGSARPGRAPVAPAEAPTIMRVYKSATCGCCKEWVKVMQAAGFDVRVNDVSETELSAEKDRRGVGNELASCHTAVVNGYVVEGHVPAEDIKRMLKEKPAIIGLAVPGMPRGSPGMEVPGGARDKYNVVAFAKTGKPTVYARY